MGYGVLPGNGLNHFSLVDANMCQLMVLIQMLSQYPVVYPRPGSVLGPLLFLLCISDLPKCSDKLTFHVFADDTNIHLSSNNINDMQSILNRELKHVTQWLYANRLSLNIDKTNYVLFHCPRKKMDHEINLLLDDKPIHQTNSVKYLGVLTDSNLSWKPHIHELSKKIAKTWYSVQTSTLCIYRYPDICILCSDS